MRPTASNDNESPSKGPIPNPLLAQVEQFQGDEQAIVEMLLQRMQEGRQVYGPWKTSDARRYPREALMEIIDALHYCAAELVRLDQGPKRGATPIRTRRVYVCHPYRNAPETNVEQIRAICRQLVDDGFVPIAPQLYLPQFLDEATERERALQLCLELLDRCDELRIYGAEMTEGMQFELQRAIEHGIPVHREAQQESRP